MYRNYNQYVAPAVPTEDALSPMMLLSHTLVELNGAINALRDTTLHWSQKIFLTVTEVAEITGLPAKTIREMCKDGTIKNCRQYGETGRKVLIPSQSIMDYFVDNVLSRKFINDTYFGNWSGAVQNAQRNNIKDAQRVAKR